MGACFSSDAVVVVGGGGGGGGAPAGVGGTHVAAVEDVPLLVRLLAGNPATSAAILSCLNTADASRLRRLHPAIAGVVAGVPWADTDTGVVDVVRWRAALPAAVGARVSEGGNLAPPALAALAGVSHLDLRECQFVTDEVLLRLPPSLHRLNVCNCRAMTERGNFMHLTALTVLDCHHTLARWHGVPVAGMPPSLQELDISLLAASVSVAHLGHLRVLHANFADLDAATLASLPPSLQELHAASCRKLGRGASFAHLPALRTLDISGTDVNDGLLASMPPSLVSLNTRECKSLTCAAVLPPLPLLRLLDVSDTRVSDALVASLPADLAELRISRCRNVTLGATLDHVPALQLLHSFGTDLAPGVLASCRARGCAAPAAGVLRGQGRSFTTSLALLADGRLVSGDLGGVMRVWDVMACGERADMVLNASGEVAALLVLRDGHRLAAGAGSDVEVWNVGVVPPVRTATVACSFGVVQALAVLRDGRLAAGCDNGAVRIIDVDAGAVAATLEGHTRSIQALAVLPGGTLASGSDDKTVRLWDVGTGVCAATLAGHTARVDTLAMLPDGRLASGAGDGTVWLWDVGTRTCVGELAGHTLAALPDGRLVSGADDGTAAMLRVWDTRPAAAAAGSHAAGVVPMVAFAHGRYWHPPSALLLLPDGRLACASSSVIHLLHVPPPAPYE